MIRAGVHVHVVIAKLKSLLLEKCWNHTALCLRWCLRFLHVLCSLFSHIMDRHGPSISTTIVVRIVIVARDIRVTLLRGVCMGGGKSSLTIKGFGRLGKTDCFR